MNGSPFRAPDPPLGAYTVAGFCEAHGIGRSLFYKLQSVNKGPRTFKAGRKTLISVEAARDWRRRMENETEQAVAANQSTAGDTA